MPGVREIAMRGEQVRHAADFAPAHRVRLAGQRERSHAGLADAARGEMAVDDRVDLVGALRRLVHALRIAGDDAAGRGEKFVESRNIDGIEPGAACHGLDIRRDLAGAFQCLLETRGVVVT
jgi:hypothetical protein